jgi:hypothetical protein
MKIIQRTHKTMSLWWLLAALFMLAPLPGWCSTPTNFILLFDTSLGDPDPSLYRDIRTTITRQSENDTPMLGVVVFNTIITYASDVKPLPEYGDLSTFLARLVSPKQKTTNLAIGIERALALAENLPAEKPPVFLLASNGIITTGDTTQDEQYTQWLNQVLAKRVVDRGISLVPLRPQSMSNGASALAKLAEIPGIRILANTSSISSAMAPKAANVESASTQVGLLQRFSALPMPYLLLLSAAAACLLAALLYWIYRQKNRQAISQDEPVNAPQPTRVLKVPTDNSATVARPAASAQTPIEPAEKAPAGSSTEQVTQQRPTIQQHNPAEPSPATPGDPDDTQIRPAAE